MKKFVTISELCVILDLVDNKNNKPLNHILRYWEKEFKQVKPKKINNRRYYSCNQVKIIKMIKYLLKNKGMTIAGAKNMLDLNINKLDYINSDGLKANYHKGNLKNIGNKLLEKINKLKKYGKKIPPKS
jgi:DNA-binding transcriptional MerR regulator